MKEGGSVKGGGGGVKIHPFHLPWNLGKKSLPFSGTNANQNVSILVY